MKLNYEKASEDITRVYLGKHHLATIYHAEWNDDQFYVEFFSMTKSFGHGAHETLDDVKETIQRVTNKWFEDAGSTERVE